MAIIPDMKRLKSEGRLFLANFAKEGPNPDASEKWSRFFPMESGEKGETVLTTFRSCLDSEVAGDRDFRLVSFKREPIYIELAQHKPKKDEPQLGPNARHLKVCLLVEEYAGKMRMDRPQPDGEDTYTPIEWWEVDQLLKHMKAHGTSPTHEAAARAVLAYFGNEYYEVYCRYARQLKDCKSSEFPPDAQEAIGAYLAEHFDDK